MTDLCPDDQYTAEATKEKKYRLKPFVELILTPTVDMKALRKLCWNGVPENCYRSLTWQLLLGYVPANASRRAFTLLRKRREYASFSQCFSRLDNKTMTTSDEQVLRLVRSDVPCAGPNCMGVFRSVRLQICLERLLYTWAMRHPASSYVQGMKDIATVLFAVFLEGRYDGDVLMDETRLEDVSDDTLGEVEADSYWCLDRILSGMQDHYTPDQPGIQEMIFRLEALIKVAAPDLWSHFMDEGINFMHFSFKWMNCFFARELPLCHVLRIWDTYLSEDEIGFHDFHVYVCAIILSHFSSQLMKMEFEDMFHFLQNLPTETLTKEDIEMFLSQAFVWRTLFGEPINRIAVKTPPSERRASLVNRRVSRNSFRLNNLKATNQMAHSVTAIDMNMLHEVDFVCY